MLTDRSRIARPIARAALCSTLAIATALLAGSGAARAQSFQGTGTFSSGSGGITTSTGTTTVSITSPQAVINWAVNPGIDTINGGVPIVFQPASTTATFQSTGNFAVLNRILPTDASRPIQFSGTVLSRIASATGGTVFFYSPAGLIVGSTGVFNVGNLGLTSSDPVVTNPGPSGTFINGNVVNFQQSAANATVNLQSGAAINAANANSYVAIVAPRIDQRAAITVNGQAALVSADAATITFNPNGLFDIQVTSGTSATGSTLFNSGSITGPASTGPGVNQRVYAVAVPKNTAITLAIGAGSTLGFNIAGAADVVGNAVVLSAGRDIVAGNIATARSAGGGSGAADLNIANTAVTSSLRGSSTDETFFFSIGGGTASTASTVNLQADTRATYTADGAGSVTTGNAMVTLNSDRSGSSLAAGRSDIFAINGGQLTITNGGATLTARGFGTNGTPGTAGGNATGGQATIQATTGGDVSITGPVALLAGGFGGSGGTGAAGGSGQGGFSQIFARDAGSSITINGPANVAAPGMGGVGNGAAGGTGTGGQAFINAQVAASSGIVISGASGIVATGQGGNSNGGAAGDGIGGTAVTAASVNNTVQFGSTLNVFAVGTGGNAIGGNAGNGSGGTARVVLFNGGTLSVGTLTVASNGITGMGNLNSATGQGGTTNVEAQNNSNLTITGNLIAASGGGIGVNPIPGTGSGRGGTTTALVTTGGAINVSGTVGLLSRATAGDGGNATGGTVTVQLNGGTLSGTTLEVNAAGIGGNIGAANSGNAGIGTGGTANIFAGAGSNTLTFNRIDVLADGAGGDHSGTAGNAGAGVGGLGQINVSGGASLTVNAADTFVEIDGEGGDSVGLAGNGGAGNAGRASLNVDGGSATFNGNIGLSGESGGGDGINGGSAFGDPENNTARALIFTRNGSLSVTGATSLFAGAGGGDGNGAGNGGTAAGGFAQVLAANGVNTTGPGIINLNDLDIDSSAFGGVAFGTGNGGGAGAGRAQLFVNGGTINVSGNADLSGDAFGGDGVNGGNAISARPFRQPRALIGSFNGSITVGGSTQISASAFGGNGAAGFGGTGGIAFAGIAGVEAQSNNGPSAITVADLAVEVSAFGGAGGSAGPATSGGTGGEAYGGSAFANGNAGQGTLRVTADSAFDATAFGGSGGNGRSGGTTAPGTAGGTGGRAIGGGVSVGTVSGIDTPSNTGSATFANVTGDASAFGGDGGDGGPGTTQGNGGAGGTGFGGFTGILVRGSPATFADVTFVASGLGGAGGAGAALGDGGDGYGGDTNLTVTQRFNRTERGSLTASDLVYVASGVGGTGATAGDSFFAASEGPETGIFVRQSDVNVATLSLTYGGALAPNVSATILQVIDPMVSGIPVPAPITVTADPFDITLDQSNVDFAGSLSILTPGEMRISLSSSTLDVGDLTLDAGNFVLPAIRPTTLGKITVAGNTNIFSGLDFLAYANFSTQNSNFFDADGSVLIGDYTSTGGLSISAGGSITTGNIQVNGDAELFAGGPILTAAITATEGIDLESDGAVSTGALTASDSVVAVADGAINVGAVSAGLINPSTSTGAQYTIALRSLNSVTAGNLAARASVGLSTPGAIATGNIAAGLHVLGLAGTSITTGSITTPQTGGTTPQTYFANFSMEPLGGQVGSTFNPVPIFQAPTVTPVTGSIAVNGPVTTGSIRANALGTVSVTGATSTSFTTSLNGAGGVTAGAITAGQLVALVSTAGATSAGALAAGDSVNVVGATGATVGNVSAGIVNPTTNPNANFKIAIGGGTGGVSAGALTARNDIGVQTAQAIVTGNIIGRTVVLLPGTSLTTGGIQALNGTQPTGRVYIGNSSVTTPTLNVFSPFQSLTFLNNNNPVRTGGPITIGGAVNATSFVAATAQGISLQAVSANLTTTNTGGFIDIDAGGLATIGGALRAGDRIDIVSGDIDIAQTGSIDALSASGEVLLASNNANGMFVGDGLTAGSGYALSSAEYARVRGGEIDIVATDIGSLATDLTIGSLTINAGQLYGANGVALFASGDRATETPSGILRIAGGVIATGFAPTNEIDLLSGTVEIEAERGSLKVSAGQSDNGTTGASSLGGLIYVEADHIHIASDAILTKLRADPLYAGHIAELNAPARVQRPDGVFNALGFEINPGSTFYIQNTGTNVVPAGFLTTLDNTEVNAPDQPRTGGVEIVINGQFLTSTGTVTGNAAYSLVAADPEADSEQFFGFSSTSQLNGCVFLGGVCSAGQSDPVAALSSEITVVTNAALDESPVAPTADDSDEGDEGSSDKDDEDAEADEGSSPISPPTPLISTRALDGNVNVVEPVSGAGNPALFGSAVDETTVQGEKP